VQSTGSWVLTVLADPTVTIAAAQSICYNTAGSALTATVSGGSGANTYTWKWGTTTACNDGTSTSTGNTLATGNLTASRYYQVMTTQAVSGCASTYSATVLKTVYTQFKAGNIATTGQTICYGGTVSAISSSTAASGGNGTISYEWRRNGTAIASTNAAAYTPTAFNTTAGAHTFTRWAHDVTCNSTWTQSTGQWVLTVRTAFTAGAITTGSTTTEPGVAPSVTVANATAASGGYGTISYQWRRSGSSAATLTGSSVTYALNTDASNYGSVGNYYFNRYAKDATCNTTFTASSGQYTLTVAEMTPPGSGTYTYKCGTKTWSGPVKTGAGCTLKTSISGISAPEYFIDGTYLQYFYNYLCVRDYAANLCPYPWRLPTSNDQTNLGGCVGAVTGINWLPLGGYVTQSTLIDMNHYGYMWFADGGSYSSYGFKYDRSSISRMSFGIENGVNVHCIKD
jgi:hypothetical protein